MGTANSDASHHRPADHSAAIYSGTRTINAKETQPIPVGEGCSANPESIRTIKNGDEITAIEVRCSCGQVLRINCDYA